MMKRYFLLLCLLIGFGKLAYSQNRLYMNPIKFTDRSIQTYGHTCDNTVQFYLNGQLFTNYQLDFVCCGLFFIKFDYGLLKPGDVMEVRDGCGSVAYSQTVQDDFVYVEIPAGPGHVGNGIGPYDSSSPYARLTTRTQVGQCANLNINAHVLLNYRIFAQGTNGTTTGPFLINNNPFALADHTVDNNGQVGVMITANANGSFSATSNARFDSRAVYSGNTPLTLEYRHNGWNIVGDFRMSIGGMQMIFKNNGVEVSKRTYTGAEITTFYSVATTNPIYKLTYDSGFYRAYVNGVKVDEMQRTVVYSASAGIISNTGGLTYLTGVTYTPNQAGNQWIGALIDGVRFVRQDINVADNLVADATVINVACSGGNTGSITATQTGGKGGFQYSLGAGSYSSNNVFSNLGAGSYTVNVRDASGCVASKSVNIGQNAALNLSVGGKSDVVCAGDVNGSVTLSGSGGVAPLTYSKDGLNFVNTSTFGSLNEGNYTFTLKDAAGCTKTTTATIGFQSKIIASAGSITHVNCFGRSNGVIPIVTTGSIPSGTLQYSLNGGPFGTNATFSGLSANNYTITVKDNLCQTTVAATVNQPSDISATLAVSNQVSCFAGSNASIVTTASGGTGLLQYSIDNMTFGSSATFGSLPANSYKVWVKDANGCPKETNVVTVTQPTNITFSVKNKTDILCFGNSTGAVSLTANGGVKNYTFKIGTGTFQNDSTFTGLAANAHTFTIKDANGCEKTTSTTLTQPADLTAGGMMTQAVSCNAGTNGAIQASASGGISPYTYSLSDANYVSTTSFTGLAANTYQVWVKDNNGCKKTANVTVTQPTALTLTPTITAVKCNGGSDGAVSLTAGGGVSSYTYAQGMGSYQTSNTFGTLTANTYSFTIKDANNCTKTINATVTQPTVLVVSLSVTQTVSCFGGNNGSIATTASGATPVYQYSLDDVTYQAGSSFGTLPINTYRVWVKDANGCKMQTNPVTITQPTDIVLSVTNNTAVKCHNGNDGSVTLAATGGTNSFQFANGNGAFQTSPTFANLSTNTYTFRVRDSNNCPKSLNVTVTQPAQPFTMTLASKTNLNCFQSANGVLTVSGAGGTSPYVFSRNNATFQSSPTFSGLSALTYTIYGRDANNCTFDLPNLTLTQPTDIVVTLLSKKDVNCQEYQRGEALVGASGSNGNFTYTLSGTDFRGNPVAANTNPTGLFANLLAGNYTLQARDQVGCAKDFPITIIPKSSGIRYDLAKTLPSNCTASDGQIQVQNINGGRAPYQFNISGQANFTPNPTFSNLLNGIYVITVADSLCSYKQTADLRLPNSLNATYNITPVSCSIPTANLQVTNVTGGNGGYSWALNGGGFTNNPNYSNLAPNVYQLVVKDNPLSCQTAIGFEIKEQNRADLQLVAKTDISCFNGSDGIIKVAGTNNLSPFQYAINNSPFGPGDTFRNLPIGNYLMLAKNSFGCLDSIRVTLTQPTLLTLTHTKKDNDCFDDRTGRLEGAGNGGTTPYQYSIDGNTYQNAPNFEALASNVYTLRVRDAKGCITTNQVPVNQPTIVTVTPVYQDTVRCFGEANGIVKVIAGGGTPGYQYSKDGQNYFPSELFSNLPAGNYTFYVKDLKQCVKQNTFNVTQPTIAKIHFVSKRDPLCFMDQNGIIEVRGSGGNGGYTFQTNNGPQQVSGQFTGLTQSIYDFKLTDRRGCTDTLNRIGLVWPKILTWTSTTQMPLCFGDANGSVSVAIDGGTTPYQATLLNNTQNLTGSSYTFQNLASTTYAITVRDRNGCTNVQSVLLPQPTQLAVNIIPKNNDCFDDTTGRIEALGKEATPPYQYSLDGQNFKSQGMFTGLKANSYTLSVRDKNGCLIQPKVPIIQPTIVTVTPVYQDTIRCFGEANGAIKVIAGGGTPGYQYSKDGQNYFPDSLFKTLTAASYTFYVKDSKGCVKQNTLKATEPPRLVLSLVSQADPLCVGEQNGIVRVAAAGGNGGYVFVKDNVTQQPTGLFEGLTQAQYAFKLLDHKLCEASIPTVTLKWPAPLVVELESVIPKCVGESNGQITLRMSGGTTPYQVNYQNEQLSNNNNSTLIFNNIASGRYDFRVNDRNGCQIIKTTTIAIPESINPISLGDSGVFCKEQIVKLNSNNPNRTVKWTFEGNFLSSKPDIEVSKPGIYKLEVSNVSGCIRTASYRLINNNNALKADFLMTIQGFVGDTIYALNTSEPKPDEVTWKLPAQAYTLEDGLKRAVFIPTQTGKYPVVMRARKGECFNLKEREIEVFLRKDIDQTNPDLGFQDQNIIQEVIVFPNPNYGKFSIKVKLARALDANVTITRSTTSTLIYKASDKGQKEYNFDINLQNFIQDIYIILVQAGTSTFTKKILIMN